MKPLSAAAPGEAKTTQQYVDAMVCAAPSAGREAYREFNAAAAAAFRRHGALRFVQCWGVDVPDGELTSFPRAVRCGADETVVFAWALWSSREQRNATMPQLMADERMRADAARPFDGKRMIFGGFDVLVDLDLRQLRNGAEAGVADSRLQQQGAAYVNGFACAAPSAGREEYRAYARRTAPLFAAYGALGLVECWGDEVPDGDLTSFPRAVRCGADETVVFSWLLWPSKAASDEATPQLMADERMRTGMPFDGRRLVHGGFEPLLDS